MKRRLLRAKAEYASHNVRYEYMQCDAAGLRIVPDIRLIRIV